MSNQLPTFTSFLMAGFECTYAKAEEGRRFDLLKASRHDQQCRQDYQLIKERGIFTVREGLAWSQIDKGQGDYDFSRFEPLMKIGAQEGIQQIWDLNHFDFPDHLDPFSPSFSQAYGEYGKRALEVVRKYQKGTLYFVPVCEPSFFSWMCDRGLWAPYAKGKGTEFKKSLIKAAITAMKAIWEEDKDVHFIHVDPYMIRQPLRKTRADEVAFCEEFNETVRLDAWNMICGRSYPELGGEPQYLDIIGINYYLHNQQFVGFGKNGKDNLIFRTVPLGSPKRIPLSEILKDMHERYGRPMVMTETGSYRDRRPKWWNYILKEIDTAKEMKLPLYGVCAYPTLDILYGAGFILPKSGLWDFDQKAKDYRRIPYEPAFTVIEEYVKKWKAL
jgi:beta-glucosidase/6-phospho-beta-glucosidase/beta-galactosidase